MREGSWTSRSLHRRLCVLGRALVLAGVALWALTVASEAAGPSVPDQFRMVVSDGIAMTGYYDATAHTAYVRSDASDWAQMHERCHAHQHLTILIETGKEPVGDRWQLDPWYATAEGTQYIQAIAASAYRWPREWLSDDNPLEDFANACGLYYLNPGWLYSLDPIRYHAVAAALEASPPPF